MRAAVKQFIEETIDLIEEDKWSDVAYKAESWLIDNKFESKDLIDLWKIVREDLNINILTFDDVEVIPSFYLCSSAIAKIIIPERILHINHSAFENCLMLKEVSLPKNLTSIGNNAFRDTYQLKELIYLGTKDEFKKIRIGWNAFGYNILGRNGKKLIARDGVINL